MGLIISIASGFLRALWILPTTPSFKWVQTEANPPHQTVVSTLGTERVFLWTMPQKKVLQPDGASQPIGPYSSGIRMGDFIFLSGQIPLIPSTGEFPDGITAQTEQVITNIKVLLAAEGVDLDHVIKSSVFMADLTEFGAMNAVYEKHFSAPFPARSTFQVARLPRDARVEIEVIAHI